MPKLNQRGIVHLFIPLILLLGIIAGVYLIRNTTKLFPKAGGGGSGPVSPETSFSLVNVNAASCDGMLCKIFTNTAVTSTTVEVDLFARSDIEASNLFSARINFPTDLLEVTSINTDSTGSKQAFITNWAENYYNSLTGEIALTGGIPNPGIKSDFGYSPLYMATIIFKPKKEGKGTISFTDSSSIYSNLNNINILTVKRNLEIEIAQITSSPVPTPVPSPTIAPSATPTPIASPIPGRGDGNGDGRIDLADLSVLLSDLWKVNFRSAVDLNADGVVNAIDFGLMRNLLIEKGVIRDSNTNTPAAKRVFITSTTYDGNLGGLEGADAKCQARADAANLGETWKAWLSGSTTPAVSRLNHFSGQYKLLNGIVIANNWADLTSGTLRAPIDKNEFNAQQTGFVWTNTTFNGEVSVSILANICNDFTSNGYATVFRSGFAGLYSDQQWTDRAIQTACNAPMLLYCFEQ